jgi:hypothetical protein
VGGAELTMRNRYKPLVKSVEGKVDGIVPFTEEVRTPMVVGAPAKLPVLSEICAEKTFAAENVPGETE